jgi:hypothetical protein
MFLKSYDKFAPQIIYSLVGGIFTYISTETYTEKRDALFIIANGELVQWNRWNVFGNAGSLL